MTRRKKQKLGRQRKAELRAAYGFLMPTIVLFLAIFLFPILFVLFSSFTSWNLLKPAAGINFVGLKNYATLLQDPNTWKALANTAVFTVVSVPVSMVLGMLMALSIEKLSRGRSLVEALLLIPMMVAPVSIYLAFKFLFEPTYGVMNKCLALLGIAGPGWFSSAGTAMLTVIIVEIWRVAPFVYIVLYAALKTVPAEPLEAARVDGANAFQVFWRITVPMIKPTLLVTLIVRMMDAIRAFDNIYVLTQGGPASSTKTIQYICYEIAFGGFAVGKGSALAIIIVLIIFITGLGLLRTMNKTNREMM